MTQRFLTRLQLPTNQCFVDRLINAADGNASTIAERFTEATFHSTYNNLKHQLNFLIVPKIADRVPNEAFPREQFDIPKSLKLADPQFHVPRPIDVLLASGSMMSSLAIGQIKLGNEKSQITLQKISFGWVTAGDSMPTETPSTVSCNVVKLDQLLERFMAVEDLDYRPVKARDDVICKEYYVKTTTRNSSGRYTARLPFRPETFEIGSCKHRALQRLRALERKFSAKPAFQAEYKRESQGYLDLDHMTLCEDDVENGYYLPHHAVVKESSETTKCRVVFEASAKTSTGISLNDILLTGSIIQDTLLQQILRFRTHSFVITEDIEKMYRQVWVHPDDRKFQKILWYYEAIRTLFQLAMDERANFPQTSLLLRRDFYVDDFLSGADTLEDILAIRDEMIELLSLDRFVIQKWTSNHPFALKNIDKKIFDLDCGIEGNRLKKTLGIVWDSQLDIFTYTANCHDPQSVSTKRKLLSQIARIFDPLGLLGPLILSAKTLIQKCWRAKLTWDEHSLKISTPNGLHPISTEMHGFCDASLYGYGACLFICSVHLSGNVAVRLACSKSKVASFKHHTMPHFLAGAALLKLLYNESKAQLYSPNKRVIFWTDSMIVLYWLKKASHMLRTYESNRVADIQKLDDEVEWRHIR
ncbi:uncharacterized protein LOC131663394 [Phymastichus coffea]|uniref:uncharacterized protein LOC131663394 n=1 Tax=Phymastichus coffea TaxID=108790 RepID=UPI00273C406C|nr:uncharacterized protein LOC131663394 [Phymastichus coffea]